MVTRTTNEWLDLFKQQTESGLLASEFCRKNNLCSRYFSKRKRDLLSNYHSKPIKKKKVKAFVKVQRPAASTADVIQLEYHHAIMRLPASVAPDWLANLLKALA